MKQVNAGLSELLKPYIRGWVVLNKQQTKVLTHADTFAEINHKIRNQNPNEVILTPVMQAGIYEVSSPKTEQKQLIADLRALHKDIISYRKGKSPIDIEAIIDEMREEREHEILDMR